MKSKNTIHVHINRSSRNSVAPGNRDRPSQYSAAVPLAKSIKHVEECTQSASKEFTGNQLPCGLRRNGKTSNESIDRDFKSLPVQQRLVVSNPINNLNGTPLYAKNNKKLKPKLKDQRNNRSIEEKKKLPRAAVCPRCWPLCLFSSIIGAILVGAAISGILIAFVVPKDLTSTKISNTSTTGAMSTFNTTTATASTATTTTIVWTTASLPNNSITSTTTSNSTISSSISTSTGATSSTTLSSISSSITTSSISTTTGTSSSTTSSRITTSTTSTTTSTSATSSTSSSTSTSTSTSSSTTTSRTTTSTTSTSTTTITTTSVTKIPVINITRPGSLIFGLYNTFAGGPTGGFEGRFPNITSGSEVPAMAIDGLLSSKYVNHGINGTTYDKSAQHGKNTGFFITPPSGLTSIACGIRFATANDIQDRDPITITLEGTNATNLNSTVWTLLYSGPSGLSATTARTTYGATQQFGNTLAFISYRLLVTSQRGLEDSTQYSEVQILGC